ncbi:Calcium-binding mitochondrial carrier protein SCaMC-2 [Linum perenne]
MGDNDEPGTIRPVDLVGFLYVGVEMLDAYYFLEKIFRKQSVELEQLKYSLSVEKVTDFQLSIERAMNGATEWLVAVHLIREFQDFFELEILFGGINFNPLFSKFTLYPLAGFISVAIAENFTAPLSLLTILSQVEGASGGEKKSLWRKIVEIVGEENLWYISLASVPNHVAFCGINFLSYLSFKSLLMPMEMLLHPDVVVVASGGLAATTSYLIFHLATSAKPRCDSHPGAWRVFCNICRDIYDGLSTLSQDFVLSMGVNFSLYDSIMLEYKKRRPNKSTFVIDLVGGFLVGLGPSIRRNKEKPKRGRGCEALWRGNWASIAHHLTFYGINYYSYMYFKTRISSIVSPSIIPPAVVAFASGGLAATIATLLSHHLDTLRTRMAVETCEEYQETWRTFCDLYEKDDLRSFNVGMSASLLGIIPSMAITSSLYHCLSVAFGILRPGSPRFLVGLVCSSLSGLAASVATYPIELVQRRMQTAEVGLREAFEAVVEKEGVAGLYRGIETHCLKVVIGNAVTCVAFEVVKIPFGFLNFIYQAFIGFKPLQPPPSMKP